MSREPVEHLMLLPFPHPFRRIRRLHPEALERPQIRGPHPAHARSGNLIGCATWVASM